MSKSFRNTDPALTPVDLAYQAMVTAQHTQVLLDAVVKLAFQGATGAAFDRGDGACTLARIRADFEESIEVLRSAFVEVLDGRKPPRGNVPALGAALSFRLAENEVAVRCRPRDPLIHAAHDRGDRILQGLPPFPIQPVADAHQAGFGSFAGA